jgi:hypothetical protein
VIIVVAYLLVLASVPLFGGRLSRLGSLRVRHAWSVAAALVVQIVIVNVVEASIAPGLAAVLHLASYGVALWFVALNRRVAGIGVIVAGGLMNLVAIAANGGVMPASAAAVRAAGRPVEAAAFQNSQAIEDARLWFLGDIMAWPAPLPLANVFSVGDVLIVIGAGQTMHVVCASRLAPRARGRVLSS